MATDPQRVALAQECAEALRQGFRDYNRDFREITRRARVRFQSRDWITGHRDAVERIELYDQWVDRLVEWLRQRLGDQCRDRELWKQIKAVFSDYIQDYVDLEFTKTYFSSITRRIFGTVGVDPEVEYVALEARPIEAISKQAPVNVYAMEGFLPDTCRQVLQDYSFEIGWENFEFSRDFLRSPVRSSVIVR